MQPLAVHKLDPAARIPEQAYEGDAGFDLCALEDIVITAAGGRASVRTGIALEIPERCAGLVLPRSGLAMRHGVTLTNSPGLIDAGYRGEICVLLLNTDPSEDFAITAGDRIAQLVIVRFEAPKLVELTELAESARGEGGFGSSGVQAGSS